MTKDIFHCFNTLADSIEQLKINESEKIIDGIAFLIKRAEYFLRF